MKLALYVLALCVAWVAALSPPATTPASNPAQQFSTPATRKKAKAVAPTRAAATAPAVATAT